jgi:hypothetical protein
VATRAVPSRSAAITDASAAPEGEVGVGADECGHAGQVGFELEFTAGQGVEEPGLGFGAEAGFGHVADLGEDRAGAIRRAG